MRHLILFFGFFAAQSVLAADSDRRLDELENRLAALESAVHNKLGDCQMKYKHHTYRHTRCDEGTFARGVQVLPGGAVQLECGYYQLQCSLDVINGSVNGKLFP